ncbi:MAG TPA: WD40 repeat domain-containing protein, partial [Miltoncostaeaceae bacterium]|nr:WD40 repeat domain-containing protein [Miltoncostaeaceae bacterium]
ARPMAALAAEMRRGLGDGMPAAEALAADAAVLDGALAAALAGRPAEERVVLLVDQFEEVFTLAPPAAREAFLDALVFAASIPQGRLVLLLTMRADFTAAAAGHPRLAALMAGRQLLVGGLGAEGLRRAIEEPARAVGLDLEEGLTRRILTDVRDRPGALPLVEHLLVELWRRRRDGLLTLEAYEASGGIEGALAQRADAAYAALPDGRREVARRVLLRLVNPGDGAEDTRRRVELDELAGGAPGGGDVGAVVEALAAERLLTVGTDEASGARVVEITHEALLRAWPQLRGWLDDERDALRRRLRLLEAAKEWEASGRDDGLLYGGARLETWRESPPGDLSPREADFLAAGVARADRERRARTRRVRATIGGLAAALVVVGAGAGVALWQRGEAQEQRDVALSRQLAVNAETSLDDDPELSLLLAREAFAAAPTVAAEQALREATEESRLLGAFSPRGDEIYGLDPGPDGALVATGTSEGELLVVDTSTGRVVAAHDAGDEGVFRVDLSADGRLAAGGDEGGTVTVWDWRADRVVRRIPVGGDEVRGVSFSPDGTRLAVAYDGGTARIWRVRDGRSLRVLRGHDGRVGAVAWSPDGRTIATAGDDTTVRLWDAATGRGRTIGRHGDDMSHVSWSPDGRRLVTGGDVVDEGYAYVWDVRAGGAPVRLGPQGSEVYQAAWSPDGRTLATAGSDSAVLVWNVGGGPPRLRLRPHDGTSNGISFRADGRTLASTDSAGTLRVWDVAPARERAVLWGHDTGVLGADWSPDGRRVLSGGNDRTVRIWDAATGRARVLRGHTDEVWGASFSPDGRRFVTGSLDTTVRIWDTASGRVERVIRGHGDGVPDAAWSPAGDVVASGDISGVVLVNDARTGRRLARLNARQLVWGTRFSRDGTLLVTGGQDGVARVWDWRAGRELATLEGAEGAVWRSSFSPDARHVATNGDDGVVRVWDWRSGDPPQLLRGHRGRGFDALFSPDGALLATSGEDQTVRVWDWRRGVTVAVLRGHSNAALRLAWNRDGTRLLSTSDDGDIRVWRCGTCGAMAEVERLADRRAVRDLTPEERDVFFADR